MQKRIHSVILKMKLLLTIKISGTFFKNTPCAQNSLIQVNDQRWLKSAKLSGGIAYSVAEDVSIGQRHTAQCKPVLTAIHKCSYLLKT